MSIERLMDAAIAPPAPADLYRSLDVHARSDGRPYVVVNMVATVDGKTLQGPRGTTAAGLGSDTDQRLMRRIQEDVDAAIVGAATLRAGNLVYPPNLWRVVLTASGDVPLANRFFLDAPERAIVFAPRSLPAAIRENLAAHAHLVLIGEAAVDPGEALAVMFERFGVGKAVLEGGADLNARFFGAGLVDEMFLTVAPKVKGGAHLPTVVDGPGLPDRSAIALRLVSVYRDGDELYLRYRVGDASPLHR